MHIAVIPDGNRRYMQKHGILNLRDSYERGINKFYEFLEWCTELGANEVTIYALSTENIENRGKQELTILLNLFADQALNALNNGKIHENKVRVNICGDLEYLSKKISNDQLREKVIESFKNLEQTTQGYDKVNLNLAIAYGGRAEIINAAKSVVNANLPLTEENLKEQLWVKSYPDIIIRTSESRLSNFLLFQGAYSEIYFIPKLWQEFEKKDLVNVIKDFNSKERRFGR
jgi:undecaprenyl diphosphate synthase